MRLRGGMLRKVAGELDRSGFRAVEVTGSSLMECSVRYSREDPWESLDLWRTWLPSSELRSPVCQNRIGTFGMTPDALMDLWVRTLVRHGIDALWVYDCLYNMGQMKRLCDVIAETGAKALGAIMYGISPVHTDEWFAQRVRQMASWPSVSAIYVEDAPGILTPERARTLIPAHLGGGGGQARRVALPQQHRDGRAQLHDRRRAGRHDPAHLLAAAGQRAVAAVHRADRGQPRPARPRARHRRGRAAARRRSLRADRPAGGLARRRARRVRRVRLRAPPARRA